ncbi:hypothetical protein ACO0QE_001266 [Hanseniaspora vineae]
MLQTKPIKVNEFIIAIRSVSDEELVTLENEIKTSLRHLESSNARMQELKKKALAQIKGDDTDFEAAHLPDEDVDQGLQADVKLYEESIRENESVIDNHHQRIAAVENEKEHRGLGQKKSSSGKSASAGSKTGTGVSQDNDESGEQSNYVYL